MPDITDWTFTGGRAGTSDPDLDPSTSSVHVTYPRSGRGTVLTAVSTPVRRARELGFYQTEVRDADARVIATASSALSADRHGGADVAGACVPWTHSRPSDATSGVTITLHAHILGELPDSGVVARAGVTAHDDRFFWCDVDVFTQADSRLCAKGHLTYRYV